jgi:hypothetical protein
VVIDLKVREFEPEYAGKMNFYLSAVDELLRRQDDGPSIGLILCKGKGKTPVEYALGDTNKPIGVSDQHTLERPHPLQGEMPLIEDLADAIDQLKEDQYRDQRRWPNWGHYTKRQKSYANDERGPQESAIAFLFTPGAVR